MHTRSPSGSAWTTSLDCLHPQTQDSEGTMSHGSLCMRRAFEVLMAQARATQAAVRPQSVQCCLCSPCHAPLSLTVLTSLMSPWSQCADAHQQPMMLLALMMMQSATIPHACAPALSASHQTLRGDATHANGSTSLYSCKSTSRNKHASHRKQEAKI
jgi:hypothetical protein